MVSGFIELSATMPYPEPHGVQPAPPPPLSSPLPPLPELLLAREAPARGSGSFRAAGPQPGSELLPPDRAFCYPNPVADGERVYLRFFLNEPARIQLEVFDAIGERIQRIDWAQELATPAENEMGWSTRGYASGLYVCRLQARTADGREALAFVRMAVSR